ncbi:uncharacterized protein LOC116214751 isoform X3 [Punica granatum]|uniref:Uncharacterized protein LOC116214751 isoform X3 n=1 Tax=Punica granatum TaxID=22663 RepID=A0A6P8EH13_PUNGR|nr:uncharacterized protein LOC116214751 isoform X3 [Punica granatum]
MVRASSISSCSVVWHFFLKFLFCQYRFLLVPSLRRSKLEASAFRSSASAISSCSASARASTIRASTARASTRPGGGVLLSCSLCLCSSFVQLQTLASRPDQRIDHIRWWSLAQLLALPLFELRPALDSSV